MAANFLFPQMSGTMWALGCLIDALVEEDASDDSSSGGLVAELRTIEATLEKDMQLAALVAAKTLMVAAGAVVVTIVAVYA